MEVTPWPRDPLKKKKEDLQCVCFYLSVNFYIKHKTHLNRSKFLSLKTRVETIVINTIEASLIVTPQLFLMSHLVFPNTEEGSKSLLTAVLKLFLEAGPPEPPEPSAAAADLALGWGDCLAKSFASENTSCLCSLEKTLGVSAQIIFKGQITYGCRKGNP